MPALAIPAAHYASRVADFLDEPAESILGAVTARSPFAVDPTQRDAWVGEITLLKSALAGLEGMVLLEFEVPRIGSRIDAVLISGPAVCVIEFKVGEKRFNTRDRDQVWDYALDLKNFHLASHEAPIFPILVATDAPGGEAVLGEPAHDFVFSPMLCNADGLGAAIRSALARATGTALDPVAWATARYQPTPTIIQAAQALYAQHAVEAIWRNDAGVEHLGRTSQRVEEIIDLARATRRKAIIFVTGVPGAGKTLIGLNAATRKRDDALTHATFLSGNGPLVEVLTEALTRDEWDRRRARNERVRKGDVRQKVKAFIQNVHHFRDAGLNNEHPPSDHVVIFDEAQRAWNREMTGDFMKRKKGRPGFTMSEPEFLLSYLDRHADWAVVICLVGGGQEVNRGEAGISAWLEAVSQHFTGWSAYISPNLTDSEYAAGHALEVLSGQASAHATVERDESLHLAVSMRSFRAEHVSRFVKAVLDREVTEARELLARISPRYPIVVTRNLDRAKAWVREHARGSERYGLVASAGAERLKPHAINVRVKTDPVHYFLNDPDDTRSSFYLEDAATEFQVQGLELDWVVVTWDADFRCARKGWTSHSFVASEWQNMKKPARQAYLKNAYRVLLTRARQGMAIFVPPGDAGDRTREPGFYDGTFEYLRGIGVAGI